MIEEAAELETYLPLAFRAPKERDYVAFLWDAYATNSEHEKYQFAFLAYHMLVMSFVYFNLWQIKLLRPRDFELALIGFGKNIEDGLRGATTPFVFSVVNEKSVLRLLKLIQCDDAKIGTYGKLVNDRNETAHANGNIYFNTEEELRGKIRDMLRTVREIQTHSETIIRDGYREFLLSSRDPEERENVDDKDQITEVLVKGCYMSSSDIAYCRNFDIATLSEEAGYGEMLALHTALSDLYPPDENIEAAA